MKTKLVSLLVALFATTAIGAQSFFDYGGLCDTIISDNEVEVAQWSSDELTMANIPSVVTYQGETYSVTRIAAQAFYNNTNLTSVTIPNSVTSIGGGAFYGCRGLTSITIPNSVMSIENLAFSGCSGLTSITIPNSVTSIGVEPFYLCTSLTSIIWNAKSCMDCSRPVGRPFDNIKTQITSFTIGDMVVTIPAYLCYGMEKLTTITIPNSVTSIGNSAFVKCTGLTSIVVKNGNTIYDSRNNCNAIVETKNNSLILGCQNTTIPSDVTSIGDSAFYNCTGLTSIAIPNSVMNIGVSAFQGCTNLAHVALSNSLTSINSGVFVNCTSLTSIVIPDGVTSIGEKIEGNGFSSYEGPFQNCTGLTSITIPSSVTSIGINAFGDCSGLTSITIPNSVTSIYSYAFGGCTGLTSITIPNSVRKIWAEAFAYCTNLASITIGNNEHLDIGWGVFANCESLESVICYADTPPTITFYESEDEDGNPFKLGAFAFYTNRLSEMKLYVPTKAIEQYKKAEEWKDFGQIIPIGATTIETDDDKPIVQPSLADVTITWKIVPNADTYTIAITRGAETVCTLVFDADGVLSNIAYAAPARNGEPRHYDDGKGYRFTIVGLETGTQYDYSISAKDKNGKELQTYSGTFKTQEEGSAVENTFVGNADAQQKVFRDGQVLIQRGGKTYTLTGEEVE